MEQTVKKSRSYKKRVIWNLQQVRMLIDLWKENQEDLIKSKRNSHVIVKIHERLNAHGIPATMEEIRTKMHNLKGKYSKVNKIIKSGGARLDCEWEWYDDMQNIFENTKDDNSTETPEKKDSENDCDCTLSSDPLLSSDSLSVGSFTRLASPVPSELTLPDVCPSKNEKDAITKVLYKIESGLETIEKFLKNKEEVDKQMLANQKYLIQLEKRKTQVFEKMCEDNMKVYKLLLRKKSKKIS